MGPPDPSVREPSLDPRAEAVVPSQAGTGPAPPPLVRPAPGTAAGDPRPVSAAAGTDSSGTPAKVRIVAIDIPFWSLTASLLKLALAALPALALLVLASFGLFMLFGLLLGGALAGSVLAWLLAWYPF